mgnify:CR=1 FL=1
MLFLTAFLAIFLDLPPAAALAFGFLALGVGAFLTALGLAGDFFAGDLALAGDLVLGALAFVAFVALAAGAGVVATGAGTAAGAGAAGAVVAFGVLGLAALVVFGFEADLLDYVRKIVTFDRWAVLAMSYLYREDFSTFLYIIPVL